MVHDNMYLPRIMDHAHQVEKSRLRKRNRELKGKSLLKVVLPRVGLTFKTSLSSRGGFQTSFLQMSPLAMIGYLTQGSKGEKC